MVKWSKSCGDVIISFLFLMGSVMKVSEVGAENDTHIPVSQRPRVLSLWTELLGVVK